MGRDTRSLESAKDSLLFTQSKKAEETNKEWAPMFNHHNRELGESQLLRSRTSSRGRIFKFIDTVK